MQLNYATIHRKVTLVTITGQQKFSGLAPRVNPDNQKIYTERTFVRVSGPCVFVPRRARGGCGLRDRPCVAGPAASRACGRLQPGPSIRRPYTAKTCPESRQPPPPPHPPRSHHPTSPTARIAV